MPSQTSPVWNHEVTYHPEPTRLRDRVSNDYYWVALPDKIEKIGFGVDQCLELEKHEEDGAAYLSGVPGDPEKCESRKQEHSTFRKIFEHSGNTWLSIPVDWIDDFIENRGDELLIVEVNEVEETPHIRVYKNSDYNEHRIQALQSQGDTPISGAPVVVSYISGKTLDDESGYDLADGTEYESSLFELYPFDAHSTVFEDEMGDEQYEDVSEKVEDAVTDYSLEPLDLTSLSVTWYEETVYLHSKVEDATLLYPDEDSGKLIYRGQGTGVEQFHLPKKGFFVFSGSAEGKSRSSAIYYEDGEWKGYYLSEQDSKYRQFLGIPTPADDEYISSWPIYRKLNDLEMKPPDSI